MAANQRLVVPISFFARVVALALLLPAAPATAQTASSDPEEPGLQLPSGARAAPDIDEITVVGERSVMTDVQDEASAVTAFNMDDLDRANITNVENLAFNVPGLHVGTQGSQVIVTLRGIGTENASPTGEPGVAFNVDGVNYVRPAAAQVAFFDLEGVEVLRGPQGTKGGKNATSGWISVITRKPHNEFESSLDYQVGSYDQRRLRGALNIPLTENFSLRSAAIWEERDGYLDNTFLNDEDRDPFDVDDFGFRQHLRWTVTDRVETLFTYNYYRQGGNGSQVKLIPQPAVPSECRPNRMVPIQFREPNRIPALVDCYTVTRFDDDGRPVGAPEFLSADQSKVTDRSSIQTDTPADRSNRFWGFTSTTDFDVPAFAFLDETQLKVIGGFEKTELDNFQDFDGSDVPASALGITEDHDQHSVELQWFGDLGDSVQWQLGGSYFRASGENEAEIARLSGLRLDDTPIFDPYPIRGEQSVTNRSYAASLHVDWYAADTVTVGAGIRYTKDLRDINVLRRVQIPGLIGIDVFDCQQGYTDIGQDYVPDVQLPDGSFQAVSPRSCDQNTRMTTGGINLEWRPWVEQLFYARVDRGAKGGGFANFGFGTYEPEYIWAYALGAKGSFFDSRLTFSSEAFFYDYKDLQLVVLDGFSIRTDNADAEVYGFDLETQAEPLPGLRLNASLGYLHSEFTDYMQLDPIDSDATLRRDRCIFRPSPINPCPPLDDFSGNQLSRAPEWTVTLGGEYDFYLGRYGTLTPRVSYYWQDDTYYRAFNAPLDLQEAYHFTDIKLTWRSPGESWTVEGFVNNLEDERVFQNVLVGPRVLNSPQFAWYGEPRVWGLRVGFRY